jgi:hypothetical protein
MLENMKDVIFENHSHGSDEC